MFSEDLTAQATRLLSRARQGKVCITAAESCTGGLIAALLTSIPGSSDVFERGFVTYSNEAKMELLGVPAEFINQHGAVSAHVAEAMAQGALKRSHADIAVSVTGIAGPGGGSDEKPVGLVYIAIAEEGESKSYRYHFSGTRDNVRMKSVEEAMRLLEMTLTS